MKRSACSARNDGGVGGRLRHDSRPGRDEFRRAVPKNWRCRAKARRLQNDRSAYAGLKPGLYKMIGGEMPG